MATSSLIYWVSDFEGGTVSKYVPGNSKPALTVSGIPGNPEAISVSGNDVWVAQHRNGSVTLINATTGKVVKEVGVGGGRG